MSFCWNATPALRVFANAFSVTLGRNPVSKWIGTALNIETELASFTSRIGREDKTTRNFSINVISTVENSLLVEESNTVIATAINKSSTAPAVIGSHFLEGNTPQEFTWQSFAVEWPFEQANLKRFFIAILLRVAWPLRLAERAQRSRKIRAKKGKNMSSRKTFLTAIIIGTVGLAPVLSWSQDAPAGTRQSNPEQSQPGANEKTPGTRSGTAQELSRSDMKLIQQRLQEKGYNPGNVDGTADDTTRVAIRKFQQDQGIPVTGTIDERTASQLGFQYSKNPTNRGGTAGDRPAPSQQPSGR